VDYGTGLEHDLRRFLAAIVTSRAAPPPAQNREKVSNKPVHPYTRSLSGTSVALTTMGNQLGQS
jgi:hypothetical protein